MEGIERQHVRRSLVWPGCLSAAFFLLLACALAELNVHWPYRYRVVEPTLEKIFASHIKMEHYHRTYFPYPGFVADGLVLRRNSAPDLPPVGSVEHVRVEGSWLDLLLLRRRIAAVYADGLHIVIPPPGSRANHEDFPPGSSNDFEGPSTVVGRFVLRGAMLDILRVDGGRYSFPIRQLVVTDLRKNAALHYVVAMQTPLPGGLIQAQGSFGPLTGGKLRETPVTGSFIYDGIQLETSGGLHGMLGASGNFRGNLAGIQARADWTIDGFSVGHGRRVALGGSAQGTVSALNGDIRFDDVTAKTGNTTIQVRGQFAGKPHATDLDLQIRDGRVEDVLQPFMHHEPPVVGPLRLHTHARIGPGAPGLRFLDRLTMAGSFDIPHERLTKPSTEQSLTAFSERAQGVSGSEAKQISEERDAISSLEGDVKVDHGVAHAAKLVFGVPGALIETSGDFDFRDQAVNMHGKLRMHADISHVTTGFKSILLKPLAPFFRKQGAGAVVPIRVSGRPGSYKVGQDIFH